MSSRNTIENELKALNSTLPSEPDGMPFSVPQGYFEGLAEAVMSRIRAGQELSASEEIARLSPVLASISRKMPYSVPERFFQVSAESLPAFTTGNEDSLVLSFIDKEMPYEVPKGYFASLPEQVLDKVEERKTRVVSITGRKWMRMAVAAMIVGIMTISGIVYFNSKKGISVDNPQWVARNLKNVPTQEIDEFVKTAPISAESREVAHNKPVRTSDVKAMLQDVSDKDLDAFLEQVPVDNDEDDIMTN